MEIDREEHGEQVELTSAKIGSGNGSIRWDNMWRIGGSGGIPFAAVAMRV
jgi:hypothetical protein